jgi:hypothetical protein
VKPGVDWAGPATGEVIEDAEVQEQENALSAPRFTSVLDTVIPSSR